MRFSIITPSFQSGAFLEETLLSIQRQREEGVDLQCIVLDGGSTDQTHAILDRYADLIDICIREPDRGPASAINKGFALADGDLVGWLNADDLLLPGALQRIARAAEQRPRAAFFFGDCRIVDEQGTEIRSFIRRFKRGFFPFNSRFTFQCINYISQPGSFFRRSAQEAAGFLREDLVAAWDYEFMLRLWRQGPGQRISGEALSAFRWHGQSISGTRFHTQFSEELEAALADAGRFSPQGLAHRLVRWGIVRSYDRMTAKTGRAS